MRRYGYAIGLAESERLMKRVASQLSRVVLTLALLLITQSARSETITFEDLSPGGNHYFNGIGVTPPDSSGTFVSGDVTFHYNVVSDSFGGPPFATGFAYSNNTDPSTGDFQNPYTAITRAGYGTTPANPGVYGIAAGYLDPSKNANQGFDFDPVNHPAQLELLPHFDLPSGKVIVNAEVTNTAYAYGSMHDGDSFGGTPFGGIDGTEIDFFRLTAYGFDSHGNLHSTDMLLADWNFTNSGTHFILDQWTQFDLHALGDASRIYFNVTGSKTGPFGLNTPGYFAIDDIQLRDLSAVPEPTSIALLLTGGLGLLCIRKKQKQA